MQARCSPAEVKLFGNHREGSEFLGSQTHNQKLSQIDQYFIGRISKHTLY
jgi:hypothetical protein